MRGVMPDDTFCACAMYARYAAARYGAQMRACTARRRQPALARERAGCAVVTATFTRCASACGVMMMIRRGARFLSSSPLLRRYVANLIGVTDPSEEIKHPLSLMPPTTFVHMSSPSNDERTASIDAIPRAC